MVGVIVFVIFFGAFAYVVYRVCVGDKEDSVVQSSQSVNVKINIRKD